MTILSNLGSRILLTAIFASVCFSAIVDATQIVGAQPRPVTKAATRISTPLPQLRKNGAVTQLFVDGKPYIILGGELHNSSASSIDYMRPIWDKLAALHLNTVISTVSWELVEPEEGHFDFTLVDSQIREAEKRNLHLVLIWFGSWKNGNSTYVPLWVKTDHRRFPLQQPTEDTGLPKFMRGQHDLPLSPFGESSMIADAKAFRSLMRHIREIDPHHTVIMMQVENEVGLRGDSRDRSPIANAAWSKPVPAELIKFLSTKKDDLLPETQEIWSRHGNKTSGTWAEVFGDDPWGDQVFMAWHYARYINYVAREGKRELNIPMYVNAWLSSTGADAKPGKWPSGGPVAGVLDFWRAGAPYIDLFAPDIYVDDFKNVCDLYTRSGNPLFIPEAKDQAGNLFWALGHYSALGWSVFGVEDLSPEGQIAKSYATLQEILPELATWQAEGKVDPALLSDGGKDISLGDYEISFTPTQQPGKADSAGPALLPGGVSFSSRALPGDTRPFGLVINTAPDEFLLIGSNLTPRFSLKTSGNERVMVGAMDEGGFEKGHWIPGRRLNGDEGGYRGLNPMQWVGGGATLGMLKYRLYRTTD
jgi:hypothetical protein